jgi:DNA-binding HxlR family transcriptional regulator
MTNRWDPPQHVIGLIDGRWTLAVIAKLQDGGRRYQELDDALDGVSHKVLTDTLRRLERDGLIEVVPTLVEVEVAVPRLTPAIW